MTAKTELNLMCLNWWKAPAVYESTRVGGPPHDPLWNSKCTLPLPCGKCYAVENVRGSQKTAENIVASYALQECALLQAETVEQQKQITTKEKKVIDCGTQGPLVRQQTELSLASSTSAETVPMRKKEEQGVEAVVFVDCDNIAFCNAAFCSRFPLAVFRFYVSFQRNMPFVDNAVRMCANTTKCPALHNGSDVCDVMILFDVVRLVDECERTGNKRRIIIVSGDKLLYNAQLLLSPHVLFLGSCDALEHELLK